MCCLERSYCLKQRIFKIKSVFWSTAVKLNIVSISLCLQIIHWAVLTCLEVDGGSSEEWIWVTKFWKLDASASFITDMWKTWSFAMLRNEMRKDRNMEKLQRRCILKKWIEKCRLPLFWIYSTVQRYWGILYCGIQKCRFLYILFSIFLLQCTQNPRRLYKGICGPARLCWETFLHGLRAPPQRALLLVSQAMNHMRQEMQNPGNTIPRLPGQNVSFHCGINWLMCPHPVTHIIYRWKKKKKVLQAFSTCLRVHLMAGGGGRLRRQTPEGIVYSCHEPVACHLYLCTHLVVCVCRLAAACSNP